MRAWIYGMLLSATACGSSSGNTKDAAGGAAGSGVVDGGTGGAAMGGAGGTSTGGTGGTASGGTGGMPTGGSGGEGGKPEACIPGCNGSELVICNTGGVKVSKLCDFGCDATANVCKDPACDLTDKRCNPSAPQQVQTCKADQTGWDDGETCANACVDGVCQVPCTSCNVVAAGLDFDRLEGLSTDGKKLIWAHDGFVWMVGTDGTGLHHFEPGNCLEPFQNQFIGSIGHFTIRGTDVYARMVSATSGARFLKRFSIDANAQSPCEVVLPFEPSNTSYLHFDRTESSVWANYGSYLTRIELPALATKKVPGPAGFVPSWTDANALYGAKTSGSSNTILRVARDTLTETVLATSVPSATGLLKAHVVWADAAYVYVHSNLGLLRIPQAAGTPTPIAGPQKAWEMAVDGSDVVWYQLDAPNVYRMPIAGGSVTTISTGSYRVRGLTWDAGHYYFMESAQPLGYGSNWTLRSVPK